MVKAMWVRRMLLALVVAAAAVSAACGNGGEDSPFEGSWVAANGTRLTFSGSSWTDSDGDTGDFEFTGEYPVFTVIFHLGDANFFRRATFADERTLELCSLFSDGSVTGCVDLVLDRPTLH